MDLRQSKRYQLRASAAFSWESADGRLLSGAGYTRDISPIGVFVFSGERLPVRTMIRLALTLPSTTRDSVGATLNTLGRVVRAESDGFAVAADTGLRMQFPETREHSLSGKVGGNGRSTHEAKGQERDSVGTHAVPRFFT